MNLDNNKNVVETARNMLIEESMYIMLRKEERISMLMERVRPRTYLREQLTIIDGINDYEMNHLKSLRTWSGMTEEIAQVTGLSTRVVYALL